MPEFRLKYTPREQFIPFHQRSQRWAGMVCHRRAGKTVACVNELVLRATYTKKKHARYAYVAPFYKQAKDIAWEYLKEAVRGYATDIRESELRVKLPNGAWITLYGADKPDALRGLYFDGIVLDEYGDCRPSLWREVILPALADRKGWAVFIGTPKGKNHFYEQMQRAIDDARWFDLTLKASESGIIDPEELETMREEMDDNEFRQEFECDFTAAVKGTYYAEIIGEMEQDGRIGLFDAIDQIIEDNTPSALYDPYQPVYCAMDLGRKDSTAIWFWQEHRDTVDVINYVEFDDDVIQNFIDYFNKLPYQLDEVWVPHDATQKTVQTKRSSIQQLQDAGFNAKKVPSLSVQQGIDAVRLMLRKGCRIDQRTCYDGIEALRAYKREYNETAKVFRDKPLHNWASDGADAFRYLSLVAAQKHGRLPGGLPGGTKVEEALPGRPVRKEPVPPKPMRLDELFAAHEQADVITVGSRRI